MKNIINIAVFSIWSILIVAGFSGCSSDRQCSWTDTTDVSGQVVTFDSDPYLIGKTPNIYASDSMIVVKDPGAQEMILSVLDPHVNKFKGQLAAFGSGPDEITVPGAVVINDSLNSIYIFDHGQLKISSFQVDSALVNPDYAPVTINHFSNASFPDRYIYVNDSVGFARSIKMGKSRGGYEQGLCKYNLKTGELTEFDSSHRIAGLKSLFGVSLSDSIIAEGATNNDLMNIYDFDGKLLMEIKGPEYVDQVAGKKVYYRSIKTTPKYILAGYSGREGERDNFCDKIRVFTHDGKLVNTLYVGKDIYDMAYYQPLNRLYMVIEDENAQFAYIDLDKALK
ncbi:MAG: TolB-like 6-bladed beta-propeller domain-containing protein [Staphylococcus sp.]|nr:TolB-like 6-bladed beta-propeller domain-containing protein [Staphylococcus sp.]